MNSILKYSKTHIIFTSMIYLFKTIRFIWFFILKIINHIKFFFFNIKLVLNFLYYDDSNKEQLEKNQKSILVEYYFMFLIFIILKK
jgi:hypothetical protein